MLQPNMAPYHVEYFNLKESENWHMEEGLSDLLSSLKKVIESAGRILWPLPPPSKQIITPSYERCPLHIWREGASSSLEMEGCRGQPRWTGLGKFPEFTCLAQPCFPVVVSHDFPWLLSWERVHLQCGRPRFDSWVGKIPWRRKRLPVPVFWPEECHGLCSP